MRLILTVSRVCECICCHLFDMLSVAKKKCDWFWCWWTSRFWEVEDFKKEHCRRVVPKQSWFFWCSIYIVGHEGGDSEGFCWLEGVKKWWCKQVSLTKHDGFELDHFVFQKSNFFLHSRTRGFRIWHPFWLKTAKIRLFFDKSLYTDCVLWVRIRTQN